MPGADEAAGRWLRLLLLLLAGPLTAVPVRPRPADAVMQTWQELTPDQRKRARENYEIFQRLDPGRKEDVQKNYQKWQSLPEPQREKLRHNFERYQEMSPRDRQEFDRRYRRWRRDR